MVKRWPRKLIPLCSEMLQPFPSHPTSLKGRLIHPQLEKAGAFWAVLCNSVPFFSYFLGVLSVQLLIVLRSYTKKSSMCVLCLVERDIEGSLYLFTHHM